MIGHVHQPLGSDLRLPSDRNCRRQIPQDHRMGHRQRAALPKVRGWRPRSFVVNPKQPQEIYTRPPVTPGMASSSHHKGSTRRVSKTTFNTYARGIRAFFATLEREEFVAPHDIRKARVPKAPVNQIIPFTESELKAIFGGIGTKSPLSPEDRSPLLERVIIGHIFGWASHRLLSVGIELIVNRSGNSRQAQIGFE